MGVVLTGALIVQVELVVIVRQQFIPVDLDVGKDNLRFRPADGHALSGSGGYQLFLPFDFLHFFPFFL